MSSWCNRNIPRKRDLLGIPEPFRPQPIPRAERHEVIESETYQHMDLSESYVSDIRFSDLFDKDLLYQNVNVNQNQMQIVNQKNQIVNQKNQNQIKIKINKNLLESSNAVELKHNSHSYVFVILRHLETSKDNYLWLTAYQSIRKYYTNRIIIIDDNSTINTVNGNLIRTEVIQSEFPGAAEVLPYYYFLKEKWADYMIFLHDSMFLYRAFTSNELKDEVCFHWHFPSDAKDEDKISTYLGLFKEIPHSSKLWNGCFGGTTIISYDIVKELEDKYALFSTLVTAIRNRKQRETFERLFGYLLYQEDKITRSSNFGSIYDYPDCFTNGHDYDMASNSAFQHHYSTAILKVWRGR